MQDRGIPCDGLIGEIVRKILWSQGLSEVDDEGKDHHRDDSADAILSELNQERSFTGEESLLEPFLLKKFPRPADFPCDHSTRVARTAFWAWRRFSACWKTVSA